MGFLSYKKHKLFNYKFICYLSRFYPEIQKKQYGDFMRYRSYIDSHEITSSVDAILLQSEFISLLEGNQFRFSIHGKKSRYYW